MIFLYQSASLSNTIHKWPWISECFQCVNVQKRSTKAQHQSSQYLVSKKQQFSFHYHYFICYEYKYLNQQNTHENMCRLSRWVVSQRIFSNRLKPTEKLHFFSSWFSFCTRTIKNWLRGTWHFHWLKTM